MSTTFVIFGASGDLTSRKLVPALYELHRKGRLPEDTRIVGVSRTKYSDDSFREEMAQQLPQFLNAAFTTEKWQSFAPLLFYQPGDITKPDDFPALVRYLEELEGDQETNRVYYLSTAPQFYEPAILQIGEVGLQQERKGCCRVVVEKPFGTDLESARHLNEVIHRVFDERQVYRIDHYLGKETVQNILVLRFANTIFEPIWNRHYIDHVQITAAEEVDVGRRAGYYDTAGVVRDMFQNHLLQLLMVSAMEAPLRFEADLVRDEKVKVLRAVRPLTTEDVAKDTLRGRYIGYSQEDGVDPLRETPTFAAVKLHIDNWRWKDVPFYLRSGKAMGCRTTQIVVQFREPPHILFGNSRSRLEANQLIVQIQPAEGIQLRFQSKVPDAGMQLRVQDLEYKFHETYAEGLPEAYQRLLIDAILGDASLFARSDEVELAWGIVDPILEAWNQTRRPALLEYQRGGWGPDASAQWMYDQGREWFDTCPVL